MILENYRSTTSEMTMDGVQLGIKRDVIFPLVIVFGDPFRIDLLPRLGCVTTDIAWLREYRTVNVEYKSVKFTACSHGVGGPGAAVCFQELIGAGAKVIIRLGTCGGLQEGIKIGDIVVSSAASRRDGCSDYYVPKNFPAIPHSHVTEILHNNLLKRTESGSVHHGITYTCPFFYPGLYTLEALKEQAAVGCKAVDMEISMLFICAHLGGIKSAACCVVDGCPLSKEDPNYNPHTDTIMEAKLKMIAAGLETVVCLSKENCC